MHVFLSWSGTRSQAVAETMQNWLPKVIQAVEPWISSNIEKGSRWSHALTERLEQSEVGLICLTRDNLTKPWILFEAGALSKLNHSMVGTLLLDIAHADVEHPLAQFQHTTVSRDDIRRLVRDINERVRKCGERAPTDAVLDDVFDQFWPSLETALAQIAGAPPETPEPVRTSDEMLTEMLELLRGQDRRQSELMGEVQRLKLTLGPFAFTNSSVLELELPPRMTKFKSKVKPAALDSDTTTQFAGRTTVDPILDSVTWSVTDGDSPLPPAKPVEE